MNTITLPITSIFQNKTDKIKNYSYKYNFKVCEKTARIYIENLSCNPIIKYKHDWMTCFEPEKHLDDLTQIIVEEYANKKETIIYGYSFKDNSLLERLEQVSFKKNLNFKIKNSK